MNTAWEQSSQIIQSVMATVEPNIQPFIYGVAAAFTLFNWYLAYANLTTSADSKQVGITLQKIIWGVFYLILTAACFPLLGLIEGWLSEVGNYLIRPNADYVIDVDEAFSNTTEGANGSWFDPSTWLYEGLRWLAFLFIPLIDYIYFFARGGILFLLALIFPFIMALGALDAQRHLFLKFLRLYAAIYLSGYAYLLMIFFCHHVWVLLNPMYAGGGFSDLFVLIMVLLLKKTLFTEVNNVLRNALS